MSLRDGREARDKGIASVSSHNEDWSYRARQAMRRACHQRLTVSAVDLQRWAKNNDDWPEHMNAFGAVFRGKEWVWTGDLVQCRHKKGHARTVKVWTLADDSY